MMSRMLAPHRLSAQLTIATVNTHWGSMLHEADSLAPVAAADVVLLQEVIDPDSDLREPLLRAAGFDVVHVVGRFGLAILKRRAGAATLVPGSLREHRLRKMDAMELRLMQRWAQRSHGFTEHGVISAEFAIGREQRFTVANVHVSMPIKPIARAMQIAAMGRLLAEGYGEGPLVVAGDMNHYPKPGLIDKGLCSAAGLERVALGKEPTWYVRGTSQEKYLRAIAQLRGRPLSDFDAQLDAVLYRGDGLEVVKADVADVKSDHRAIVTTFSLNTGACDGEPGRPPEPDNAAV